MRGRDGAKRVGQRYCIVPSGISNDKKKNYVESVDGYRRIARHNNQLKACGRDGGGEGWEYLKGKGALGKCESIVCG